MAIDTNIQTFTDEELLKLNRKAQAEIYAYGSSVGSNGKSLTRADLAALREAEKDLETRIAATGGDGAGGFNVLAQFGERQ